MANYGTAPAHRDEESQALLNGQSSRTEANDTFYGRTFSHVTTHRKRYFALWVVAAFAAISTVLGLHYYHKQQHDGGNHDPEGEGKFISGLLTGVAAGREVCDSDRSYPIAIILSIFFGYVG